MILSLPLPGWLAKISKDVQEEKMKKARLPLTPLRLEVC
jgi:hypothetical protein